MLRKDDGWKDVGDSRIGTQQELKENSHAKRRLHA